MESIMAAQLRERNTIARCSVTVLKTNSRIEQIITKLNDTCHLTSREQSH
ncbi:hypothetical protein JZ785_10470 [Alicyclobacillus curvatus]|nr:hypothetical protein JZ785_10470 [Alicyclobacillus curvatus]